MMPPDFEQLLDNVHNWASKLSVHVPDPRDAQMLVYGHVGEICATVGMIKMRYRFEDEEWLREHMMHLKYHVQGARMFLKMRNVPEWESKITPIEAPTAPTQPTQNAPKTRKKSQMALW